MTNNTLSYSRCAFGDFFVIPILDLEGLALLKVHAAGLGVRVPAILALSISFAVAACQSTGKTGASVPITSEQARAAYLDCLEVASRTPVLGAGGQHIAATRLLDRCAGELGDWEDALIASGMPPDEANEITNGLRDRIREQISQSFRRIN